MNIVIDDALKAYIDPLTPDEYQALERSLLTEGCRDALVLWGELLIDGHNRYQICRQHGLPFQTVQSTLFQNLEDVHLWMIDQHLGRRSVSEFQRGVLALRKREIVAARRARFLDASARAGTAADAQAPGDGPAPWEGEPEFAAAAPAPAMPEPLRSREDLARAARLSSSQVSLIEKIHQQAAPEVVAAVKAGQLSLSAAAAVASLPEEEQRSAAIAGKDELKQAARRVREARRKPRPAQPPSDAGPAPSTPTMAPEPSEELQGLQRRVAELSAENEALRKQVTNLLAQLVN